MSNENLVCVNIPESVIYIDALSFSGCENLICANIPQSVEWIDEYAFYLKDTPLGAKLSENSDLPFPENTVICVRSFPYIASMVGKEEKQKQYDYQIELFKNITCESVKDTND